MGRQPLGADQQKWLDRIREAGGEIKVSVTWTPVAHLMVDGGSPIRVPIRLFESLFDRGMFEELETPGHESMYRLVE